MSNIWLEMQDEIKHLEEKHKTEVDQLKEKINNYVNVISWAYTKLDKNHFSNVHHEFKRIIEENK